MHAFFLREDFPFVKKVFPADAVSFGHAGCRENADDEGLEPLEKREKNMVEACEVVDDEIFDVRVFALEKKCSGAMFGNSGTVVAWHVCAARSASIQAGEVFAIIPRLFLAQSPCLLSARVSCKRRARRDADG